MDNPHHNQGLKDITNDYGKLCICSCVHYPDTTLTNTRSYASPDVILLCVACSCLQDDHPCTKHYCIKFINHRKTLHFYKLNSMGLKADITDLDIITKHYKQNPNSLC